MSASSAGLPELLETGISWDIGSPVANHELGRTSRRTAGSQNQTYVCVYVYTYIYIYTCVCTAHVCTGRLGTVMSHT